MKYYYVCSHVGNQVFVCFCTLVWPGPIYFLNAHFCSGANHSTETAAEELYSRKRLKITWLTQRIAVI